MFRLTTPRLGDILLELGVITAQQLADATELQSLTQVRLGSILVAKGWITEEQVTQAMGIQMELPYVNIAETAFDRGAVRLIPNEIAKRYQLLPLSIYESPDDQKPVIRVAMVNPWDVEAIELVQRVSWHRVEPVLASKAGMSDAQEKAYQLAEESQASPQQSPQQDDVKIMLQKMLENSIGTIRQNLAELEDMQQYLNTI